MANNNPYGGLFDTNKPTTQGVPVITNPYQGIFNKKITTTDLDNAIKLSQEPLPKETPAPTPSEPPVTMTLPPRPVTEKIAEYISPQPNEVRTIDVVRELIPSLSQILTTGVGKVISGVGAVIGGAIGAVGEKVKQDIQMATGQKKLSFTDYGAIKKTAVETAKKTAIFGQQIGEQGAGMAPIVAAGAYVKPMAYALDAFMLYSTGKNVYDAMYDTGLKGDTGLEMTDNALKTLGAKGWETFGMPADMAISAAENPLFAASGLAINALMAYGASRGVSNNFFNGLVVSGGILKGKAVEISSDEMVSFLKDKGVNTPDLPHGTYIISKVGKTLKGELVADIKTLGKTKIQIGFKPEEAKPEIKAPVGEEPVAGTVVPTKPSSPTELAIKELKTLEANQPNIMNQAAGAALVGRINELQDTLSVHFETNRQNVLTIDEPDTMANVNVIKVGEDKWGYGYDLMAGDSDISADYVNNPLFGSYAEAVKAAKQEIINWANNELTTSYQPETLKTIINQTEKINPQLEMPITAKAKPEISLKTYHITEPENIQSIKEIGLQPTANGIFGKVGFSSTSEEASREHIKNGEVVELNVNFKNPLILKSDGKMPIEQLKEAGYKTFEAWARAKNNDGVIIKNGGKNNADIVLNLTPESTSATPTTQKEKVKQVLRGEAKTIKQVAEETKILEPNVRRILGVGAKDGTFERMDKGIYILKKDGKQLAYIETGDTVEVLPRLADEGLKADMVFLDIPYKTPAVVGGNRGIKYDYITPEEFKKVVEAIIKISRTDDTPIFHMFSQAKSGLVAMEKYNQVLIDAGLKPIARGEYTKLQQDGITRVRNMRGDIIEPEGLMLLSKSGQVDFKNPDLNFKLIRPKGYQTEKPAEMIKALIEMSTKEGEVVLDPFAGSGVVPAEAVKAGREAVAVEKSAKAVEEYIKPRVEAAARTTTLPFGKMKNPHSVAEKEQRYQAYKEIKPLADLAERSATLTDYTNEAYKIMRDNPVLEKAVDKIGLELMKDNPEADFAFAMVKIYNEFKNPKAETKLTPRFAKPKASEEFKVGDIIIDGQGIKQTIREVKGNSIYFTDENGVDYAGFSRATLRNLIKGGSWKKVESILPKNISLTDAYSKNYLGYNIAGLEKKAAEKSYNIFDAMVKRVDSQAKVEDKIKGMETIINDLYGDYSTETKQQAEFQREQQKNLETPGYSERVKAEEQAAVDRRKQGLTFREHKDVFPQNTAEIKIGKKTYSSHEIAAKIIPKRTNLPILREMRVKGGKITATTLNTAITLKSGLPDGMYKLVGKDAVKTTTDPEEFPQIIEVKGEPVAAALSENLTEALKSAIKSIADSYREELAGVHFKISPAGIEVASTDTFRLYMQHVRGKVMGNAEFIIDEPEIIQKVMNALGGKIEITTDGRYVKFSGDNGEIINIGIEGKYPDFKQIIPNYTTKYSLEKPRLLAALKDLKPHADSTNTIIIMEPGDGKMVLRAINSKYEIAKELEIFMHGKGTTINSAPETINSGVLIMPIKDVAKDGQVAYNGKFLIDALGALPEDALYLYTTGEPATTPGFFSNEQELVAAKKEPPAPSGQAATGGSKIGEFETLGETSLTPEQFKIYEEVKKLVAKYAKSIGQGYQPANTLGVFYLNTQNIRVRGLNHLSVAAHEITHFLDNAYKISNQLMGIKGYAKNGNPIYERETAPLRRELTAVYKKFYSRAKETHALKRRMLEGFATLLEKYISQPSSISAEFPNAVKEFLTPEGKYYKPIMSEILTDLREIIANYQGLSALDKIGARIVNDEVNINKDSFLNFYDKFKTEVADNVYPIEKLAKQAGVHFSKADPSLWVRQFSNANSLIVNNLRGKRGYWGWRNGEVVKLHDYNWQTLIKDISADKSTDEFASWLVARREYFAYQELDKMEVGDPERVALQKILDADGFTRAEVTEAYEQNKDRFAEFSKKYDELVEADLDFLHDPAVQLVDRDTYNKLISQQGYASFKRAFYDEVVGEEQPTVARVRFGRTKVSSMIQRKGSQRPIINPLYSAMLNHAEITKKGLKQIVYNRMGAISGQFPRLFQKLKLEVVPQKNGALIFPQERDPKIIMARSNYKRLPILADAVIKRTLDEVLNPQNISYFEKVLLGSSRFFTKGTTGLFPGFALTNYTIDQITAVAQTRNKYKPIYDPLHTIITMLNPDKPEHTYLQEYLIMGGEKQTFVGWQDMAPNELFNVVANERKGLLKAIDYLNSGMNILALPAQWSEIMTRATEYIKSREAGKSPIVALEEAGRITAPFHHLGRLGGGRVGQVFIKSIPFFNPGIQVLAQAAETINTRDGRWRYLFTSLAVVASSVAAMGLIYAMGSEEQKQLYADINPDELNKYIWLPSPDKKTLIKVRVPDQMEVVATLFNMVMADKKLNANYSLGEYLNAAVSWLPQQIDFSNPARALLAWIPQLIKPAVLTLAGVKDFPKIMPLESQMQQSRPAGLRATEATSPVAKALGKALDISPIKIDYLLTGYVGRASGFLTGKPGIYNPFASMSRQYYFTSGRKLQHYYDLKKQNDEDYYAYTRKLKTFKLGEPTRILKLRAKLDNINTLVNLYRDIDTDKQPERADKLRRQILKKLDTL